MLLTNSNPQSIVVLLCSYKEWHHLQIWIKLLLFQGTTYLYPSFQGYIRFVSLFFLLICQCKGPYSLFICASYFISCSVHARFASVTFIDCKWRWGCRHFSPSRISMFCIEAIELIIR